MTRLIGDVAAGAQNVAGHIEEASGEVTFQGAAGLKTFGRAGLMALSAFLPRAWERDAASAAGSAWDAGSAVAGIADVLEALTEQRVGTLLLAGDFHAAGARCWRDGMLLPPDVSECPVDGTATGPVPDLREPMIAAAVRQDATVLVFPEPDEPLRAPDHRVGALLRF